MSLRQYLPRYFPLPHPSWHNNRWIKLNPWFGEAVLPEIMRRVPRSSRDRIIA